MYLFQYILCAYSTYSSNSVPLNFQYISSPMLQQVIGTSTLSTRDEIFSSNQNLRLESKNMRKLSNNEFTYTLSANDYSKTFIDAIEIEKTVDSQTKKILYVPIYSSNAPVIVVSSEETVLSGIIDNAYEIFWENLFEYDSTKIHQYLELEEKSPSQYEVIGVSMHTLDSLTENTTFKKISIPQNFKNANVSFDLKKTLNEFISVAYDGNEKFKILLNSQGLYVESHTYPQFPTGNTFSITFDTIDSKTYTINLDTTIHTELSNLLNNAEQKTGYDTTFTKSNVPATDGTLFNIVVKIEKQDTIHRLLATITQPNTRINLILEMPKDILSGDTSNNINFNRNNIENDVIFDSSYLYLFTYIVISITILLLCILVMPLSIYIWFDKCKYKIFDNTASKKQALFIPILLWGCINIIISSILIVQMYPVIYIHQSLNILMITMIINIISSIFTIVTISVIYIVKKDIFPNENENKSKLNKILIGIICSGVMISLGSLLYVIQIPFQATGPISYIN